MMRLGPGIAAFALLACGASVVFAEPGAVLKVEGMEPTPFKTEEKHPDELRGGTFYTWPVKPAGAAVERGELRFTVVETGVVYLIGNWGKQGSGGEWTKTALSKEQLIQRGWEPLGECAWSKINGFPGELFRKVCKQGETYSLRTNKYWPPEALVPARTSTNVVPDNPLPSVKPAVAKRLSAPQEAELETARSAVKEVYGAAQTAAKTPDSKAALARRLLKDALETSNDPPAQFVLLRAALNLGSAGGDLEVTESAATALEARFEIDDPRAAAFRTLLGSKVTGELCVAAQVAAQRAAQADDYKSAQEFAEIAELAAKKDAETLKSAKALRKQIEQQAAEHKQLAAHHEALQADALDVAANLAVGRFLCFRKQDWQQGLPYLAIAKGTPLGEVAAAELVDSPEPIAQRAVGDQWWKLAETDADLQAIAQSRAIDWYEKALPKLTGLERAKVEKRLADAKAARYGHLLANPRNVQFLDWRNSTWENDARRNFAIRKEQEGYRVVCDASDGDYSRLIVPMVDARHKRLYVAFTVVQGSVQIGVRSGDYRTIGTVMARDFSKGKSGVMEIWFEEKLRAKVNGEVLNFGVQPDGAPMRFELRIPRQSELLITEMYCR